MSKTRIALKVITAVCFLWSLRVVPPMSGSGGTSVAFAQTVSGMTFQAEPGTLPLKSRVLRASNNRDEALQPLTELPRGERKRVIVQTDGLPDAQARQALAEQGVKLLRYVGNNSWFATVDGGAGGSGLKAAWRIEAADRLSPALYRNKIPRHAIRKDGSVAVSVEAFDDADLASLANEIQLRGGTVDSAVPVLRVLFVHMPPQLIWSLGLIDAVHWVEPVAPRPASEMSRARAFLGVDVVQSEFALTGNGIHVSVHDSGHAFRHADYTNRWIKDADPLNVILHASMTAGTIAGDGTINSNFKGMAPAATIHTYSFDDGTDDCCEAQNYADIADALTKGVDIANNSWGFPGCAELPYGDYTSQARVFDRQVLGKNDAGTKIGEPTIVVFSAGNERDGSSTNHNLSCLTDKSGNFQNYGTINQPHTAKNIITVGAVDSATDFMSRFSSWGPTTDGRIKPEIVAAGLHNGSVDLGTSVSKIDNCFGRPTNGDSNQQCYRTTSDQSTNASTTPEDDRYAWFSMTSAAAAMVSGSAALFVEDFRANTGRTPLPSTVKAHFIHTARDLDDSTSWYNDGPDYASGYGVLRIDDAISHERTKKWSEATVDQGQTNTFYIQVPAFSSIKITLVWDDAPGDLASTSGALVNDLDLIVEDSFGRRVLPWVLDPARPWDPATRGEDHVNNVEMVQTILRASSGLYKVQVRGTTVPQGPQTYSLVYSHSPSSGNVDLVVSSMNLAFTGTLSNPSIGLTATIRNQGPDTALASVTKYYLSKNTVLDSADPLIGQRSVPSLAGGASNTSTTTLAIPPGNYTGTWYIFAVTDSTSVVPEYFETNNVKSLKVTQPLLP